MTKSIDEIIAVHIERIAESPEVRQMIREESTTLLEDLLDQVRDRASRADERAEQAARRIFRRGRLDPTAPRHRLRHLGLRARLSRLPLRPTPSPRPWPNSPSPAGTSPLAGRIRFPADRTGPISGCWR